MPEDVAAGDIDVVWGRHLDVDLVLPRHVVNQTVFERQWRAVSFVTLADVGLPFAAEDMAVPAWHTLSRIRPRWQLVKFLADLLLEIEAHRLDPAYFKQLLDAMQLPEMVAARVRGEIESGRPLFDPRCLRWVICELLAAPEGDVFGLPGYTDAAREVERLMLPRWAQPAPRGACEVLRSVLLLQQGFSVGGREGGDARERILSLYAAHTFGARFHSRPADRLARAYAMWSVPDSHSSVQGRAKSPGWLRARFEYHTGMGAPEWLSMSHAWLMILQSMGLGLADNLERLMGAFRGDRELGEMFNRFAQVSRDYLMADSGDVRDRIRDEMRRAGSPYRGFGSVPKHVLRAVMDTPIVHLPEDRVAHLGIGLLTDRAIDLPRFVLQFDGQHPESAVRGWIGHLFEAEVHDALARAGPGHEVADEATVSSVLSGYGQKKGDSVVRKDQDFLVVEAYSGGLGPKIAAGDLPAIKRCIQRYHGKAEQAEHTRQLIGTVAEAAFGQTLTDRARCAYVVVVDDPLPHSPALARALREEHPDRHPRFVCSRDELDLLIALSQNGWSMPSLVGSWQSQPHDQTLGGHLERATRWTPVSQKRDDVTFERLMEGLGVSNRAS